ncbi:hypothetical protein [Clostridium beijerinckii]|uniref:Uncharacterized protein n=2 Tax=Clostridium beijerinckii TaxID=1520 RepID=A0AAE2RNU8_CLOBE|nr:hypothetical protein [Clostridium beijerinckii]ABR36403.1 conserved hypothetical protein [Clostridium beijerinckii NCIMB 8052]AIU00940.1 hypothetical protein Cbs_4293 [Clostridium beijerinckii ATCC 35702]MBF7808950.1 hypothetical protein [Clostridium beijerinckii]NOW06007.1 hypothetical protein [Clostridium beijerinckii]NRT22531.1 hypothetical protein [Clostridium beijerinckii]
MEFKLNKIDTDIRKKMQEEIKEKKVHSGKAITAKRNIKDERNERHKKNETKEYTEKKYITIDTVKYKKQELEVKAEKNENIDGENSKGRILDAKK